MLKKITSYILAVALLFTSIFTGFTLGNKTEEVYAANIPTGFNEAMIKDACRYLGYKYVWGGRDPAGPGFDCTGFLWRVLTDMGVGNAPGYTGGGAAGNDVYYRDMGGWLYKVAHRTLTLTYGGQYYGYNPTNGQHTNVVYTANAAEFNAAINNNANLGKMIVLTNEAKYGDVASVARPGTIFLFPPTDHNGDGIADAGAHVAIALEHIAPDESVTKLSKADARSVAYVEQVYNRFKNTYRSYTSKTAYIGFQLGYISRYPYLNGVLKSTNIFSGNMPFYLICNHGQPAMESASDGIGSTLWRIESTTSISSVGLTNKTGGLGNNTPTYAIYFNDGKPQYNVKLGISSTNDTDGASLLGGAYAITTGEKVAKDVAAKGMETAYSFAGPGDNLDNNFVALLLSNSEKITSVTLPAGTNTEKTVYLAQILAMDGYERLDGYFKLVLEGVTAGNGVGTKLKECTYISADGTSFKLSAGNKETSAHTYTTGGGSTYPYVIARNSVPYVKRADNPYPDVPDDAWYIEEVIYAYEHGAMTGHKDGTFRPQLPLNRDEAVTILWKLENQPEIEISEPSFLDTELNKWNTMPIEWCKKTGIVTGYVSGEWAGCFRPDKNVTREEFIKILYQYIVYTKFGPEEMEEDAPEEDTEIGDGADVSTEVDEKEPIEEKPLRKLDVCDDESYKEVKDWWKVTPYARESINWAYENRIIGVDSLLKPKDTITRAEAVTIIARYLLSIEVE